jgi:hypothetical protein
VANAKLIARRAAVVIVPFVTGLAVALTLFACCCPQRIARGALEPVPAPPIGLAHFDVPREAVPAARTQTEMRNVLFHIDRTIALKIYTMRGEMYAKDEGQPLNFDDKHSFIVNIHRGRIGVSGRALTDLMNHYVFAYEGSPLRDLVITVHEKRLVQRGIIHKLVDLPFEMTADVSVTDDGWMRIHPIDINICNVDGDLMMKAFGISLDEIIEKVPPGVRVEKNDLLIDTLKILPPPAIAGRLSDVELHEDELTQIFASDVASAPLAPPDPAEPNWMFFEGGTLRMGKLFMVRADMHVVDTDPSDPFDFFVDFYNNQLSAGFTKNQPDYGLKVFMRDYADLGTPRRPGERVVDE